jgi:hypothetical protein
MKIYRIFLMVRVYFYFLCLLALTIVSGFSKKEVKSLLVPSGLTTEYQSEPVGIQSDTPEFGWQFDFLFVVLKTSN